MATPTCTQFFFYKVKPFVTPEEPENHEGRQFLASLRQITAADVCLASSWGKVQEQEALICLAIDRADSTTTLEFDTLTPFLDVSTKPKSFVTVLNPPISVSGTMIQNPCTEIVFMPFRSDMSAEELLELRRDLKAFRHALLETLPKELRPLSWSETSFDHPVFLSHSNSPSGSAMLHSVVVGWRNIEHHKAVGKTKEFLNAILPIRQRLLPFIEGLEMKHITFSQL